MKLIKPFGPDIGHFTLDSELNQRLLDCCLSLQDDESKKFNQHLVGLIGKEFNILDNIGADLLSVIQTSVHTYLTQSSSIFSKYVAPFSKFDLKCTSSWCNIQAAGEHNPIHTHPMDDIVCVIFPQVDIDTKFKKYDTNTDSIPGSLVFHNQSSDSRFGVDSYAVTPKTGDMYIFPAGLAHYTYPFYKESDKRISVSCNFAFTEHFYSLRKLRGYK